MLENTVDNGIMKSATDIIKAVLDLIKANVYIIVMFLLLIIIDRIKPFRINPHEKTFF